MIVAFFEEINKWGKIFIYYFGDRWEVEDQKIF
jgi:hypothetical protein